MHVHGPVRVAETQSNMTTYTLRSGRLDRAKMSHNERFFFPTTACHSQCDHQSVFVFSIAVENYAHFVRARPTTPLHPLSSSTLKNHSHPPCDACQLFDYTSALWAALALRRGGVPINATLVLSYLPRAFRQLLHEVLPPVVPLSAAGVTASHAYIPCLQLSNAFNLNARAWARPADVTHPLPYNQAMLSHIQTFAIAAQLSASTAVAQGDQSQVRRMTCVHAARHGVSSQRHLVNGHDLDKDLGHMGWTDWDYTSYPTFRERAASLGAAHHFLALLGADPTNMVFLPHNATVHVLAPDARAAVHAASPGFYLTEGSFFAAVASFLGHSYIMHDEFVLVAPEPEQWASATVQQKRLREEVLRTRDAVHYNMQVRMPAAWKIPLPTCSGVAA